MLAMSSGGAGHGGGGGGGLGEGDGEGIGLGEAGAGDGLVTSQVHVRFSPSKVADAIVIWSVTAPIESQGTMNTATTPLQGGV